MICKAFRHVYPRLHPTVRAAENAAVIGDVRCEARVNFWYAVTARGDSSSITIGRNSNIQDGAVLHCDADAPLVIGMDCTIGHSAVVHGCSVGDGTLVGMNATLLSHCVIGKNCLIAAGAVVPPSLNVPDGMLVRGVPAKVIRPLTEQELAHMQENCKEYLALAEESLPLAQSRHFPTPV